MAGGRGRRSRDKKRQHQAARVALTNPGNATRRSSGPRHPPPPPARKNVLQIKPGSAETISEIQPRRLLLPALHQRAQLSVARTYGCDLRRSASFPARCSSKRSTRIAKDQSSRATLEVDLAVRAVMRRGRKLTVVFVDKARCDASMRILARRERETARRKRIAGRVAGSSTSRGWGCWGREETCIDEPVREIETPPGHARGRISTLATAATIMVGFTMAACCHRVIYLPLAPYFSPT